MTGFSRVMPGEDDVKSGNGAERRRFFYAYMWNADGCCGIIENKLCPSGGQNREKQRGS